MPVQNQQEEDRQTTASRVMEQVPSSVVLPFEIRNDPIKGRGLFATQTLAANSLLHVAPCIAISREEYDNYLTNTCLEHYLFNCRATGEKYLALGYGSLFNHHFTKPNVNYKVCHFNRQIFYYVGYKPILCGEELCISYGGAVWFEDLTDISGPSCSSSAEQNHLDVMATTGDIDDDSSNDQSFLSRLEI